MVGTVCTAASELGHVQGGYEDVVCIDGSWSQRMRGWGAGAGGGCAWGADVNVHNSEDILDNPYEDGPYYDPMRTNTSMHLCIN